MPYKQYYNNEHHHQHACPRCKCLVSGTGASRCHICARLYEPKDVTKTYSRQKDQADARKLREKYREKQCKK